MPRFCSLKLKLSAFSCISMHKNNGPNVSECVCVCLGLTITVCALISVFKSAHRARKSNKLALKRMDIVQSISINIHRVHISGLSIHVAIESWITGLRY